MHVQLPVYVCWLSYCKRWTISRACMTADDDFGAAASPHPLLHCHSRCCIATAAAVLLMMTASLPHH